MNLVLVPVGLFIGLVVCLEIGYRLGASDARQSPTLMKASAPSKEPYLDSLAC